MISDQFEWAGGNIPGGQGTNNDQKSVYRSINDRGIRRKLHINNTILARESGRMGRYCRAVRRAG
jgi:hypothetical protein